MIIYFFTLLDVKKHKEKSKLDNLGTFKDVTSIIISYVYLNFGIASFTPSSYKWKNK